MTWTRRQFVQSLSLAVVGGIFVPRYARWFRSNRIIVSPYTVALVDQFGQAYDRQPVRFGPDGKSLDPVMFDPRFPPSTYVSVTLFHRDRAIMEGPLVRPARLLPGDQARLLPGTLRVDDSWVGALVRATPR